MFSSNNMRMFYTLDMLGNAIAQSPAKPILSVQVMLLGASGGVSRRFLASPARADIKARQRYAGAARATG